MAFSDRKLSLLWLATIVVLAIIIDGGMLFAAAMPSNALKLATTHQPETFTELYFAQSSRLPAAVPSGQSIPVSFVIHNQEARTTDYKYQIRITLSNGSAQVLAEHSINLPADGQKTITENVQLPAFSGSAVISVTLPQQAETIHFQIVNSSEAAQ